MNKLIPLPLLVLLSMVFSAGAQNKTTVKGRIIDSLSHTPVEFATVAALDVRDTTSKLLAYTLSDKNGAFTLHGLPEGIPVKLLISFVAYQPFRKIFTLKKAETFEMGDIQVSPKQLQEVVIRGERVPVTVHKDTIVFDAEAFKVRPNAVVEDLLKKLPGVEVDDQGNITVMARAVSKVLVDGHQFFQNDMRIATKNLDADLISKVEIYDDREDDPDHIIPESQVKKVINLKFKKALKKSIFGKVYGGAGTNDYYQAGGLFNMFRDTLQVSLLGLTNNLNSTGFNYEDLYSSGGLNRGGDAIGRGGSWFGSPSGKQVTTSGGVNVNTDYGKKLKLNLAYLYQHTRNEHYTITNRQQLLNDTTAVTNAINDGFNTSNNHNISGTLRWKPDDANLLNYTPLVTISQTGSMSSTSSNSYSNFIDPINNGINSSSSSNNNFQFQHNFSYNHQFKKKGESINIDHGFHINPSNGNNFSIDSLTSYVATLPSYTLRRVGEATNRNNSGNLNVAYRYPVAKNIIADVTTSAEYSHQLNRLLTYNFNPVNGLYDSLLLDQSSDLTRRKWVEQVVPGITYNINKRMSLVAHLTAEWQQVNNTFGRNAAPLDQHFFFLMPTVNFNVNSLSITYSRNVQLPNIGDIVPYSVVFSPLYSVTGNPDLKPSVRNNFSFNYNHFNFQSNVSYFINGSASFEQNGVFRQRTIDANLVETSTPVNKSGRYNYNLRTYITKRFKKKSDLNVNTTTSISLSTTHNFFVVNHQDGYQDNYLINASERVSINYKDVIQAEPQYTLSQTYTTYTGVDYRHQNYLSHIVDVHFNLFLPAKMNVEGDYTFTHNPLVPDGFQKNSNLVNLSVAHQFMKKDRAEVRLSCYDLFNQNISTSRYISENTVTDTQSQIIRRYFMLTLQYKFNKSTTK